MMEKYKGCPGFWKDLDADFNAIYREGFRGQTLEKSPHPAGPEKGKGSKAKKGKGQGKNKGRGRSVPAKVA